MLKSALFGRRIHIAGSISPDISTASTSDVMQARELVKKLVIELIKRGATFVVPVDAEKLRSGDNLPICFDWLVWQTLHANLACRPSGAHNPLAVAVQHHKTEEQIPEAFEALWDGLRTSDLVEIENVLHWNMNSKRMEAQARYGDVLIALGGSEGVMFLANIYHQAGKPVIPLNTPITAPNTGALRLFDLGCTNNQAQRLFHTTDRRPTHSWVNRINCLPRVAVGDRVSAIIELLEALEKPRAFAVRLLNADHADYSDVQNFFDTVVQPVVEEELGYCMVVVDGRQAYDYARIDQEIFAKLHHSSLVLADITGMRPNCFLELGYAFGRGLPTMLMRKVSCENPFDTYTLASLEWRPDGSVNQRRKAFREHWAAIRKRPPLVPTEPLIS